MQKKNWYSILGVDAMLLSFKNQLLKQDITQKKRKVTDNILDSGLKIGECLLTFKKIKGKRIKNDRNALFHVKMN